MKRDLDLARLILLWMEEHEEDGREPELDGYTDEQIGYHCHLLKQAGLIEGPDTTTNDSRLPQVVPLNLTWDGHDFIDASKDSAVWAKAKEHVLKPAGGAAFSVLLEWMKMEAKTRLGLP